MEREPGSHARDHVPASGPKPLCLTTEEANAWADKWWATYVPPAESLHMPELFEAPESLYDLLTPLPDGSPSPVVLLSGRYLLERAARLRSCTTDAERAQLRLPRRQELPPEAILTLDQVHALGRGHGSDMPLKIVGISHGWLTRAHATLFAPPTLPTLLTGSAFAFALVRTTAEHPDPLGEQLVNFAGMVDAQRACCPGDGAAVAQRSCLACCTCGAAVGYFCFCCPVMGQPCGMMPYQFASGEFGVFYDYGVRLAGLAP